MGGHGCRTAGSGAGVKAVDDHGHVVERQVLQRLIGQIGHGVGRKAVVGVGGLQTAEGLALQRQPARLDGVQDAALNANALRSGGEGQAAGDDGVQLDLVVQTRAREDVADLDLLQNRRR
jgi:hypothetical protein